MQYPNDIDSLWKMWESNVLEHGFESEQTQSLCRHIEKLEKSLCPDETASEDDTPKGLAMAHRMFDQLYAKKYNKRLNGNLHAKRVIPTRFGAIYENGVSVRGIERLMKSTNGDTPALRLKDGFYHVNHLPGVQPTASEHVNARNKNVERVDIDVVETFIVACQETGMTKRGWKKTVNEKFDISRQEFTKWLLRYFPCYGLPVPIERKTGL